jgi:hypothetical protein
MDNFPKRGGGRQNQVEVKQALAKEYRAFCDAAAAPSLPLQAGLFENDGLYCVVYEDAGRRIHDEDAMDQENLW